MIKENKNYFKSNELNILYDLAKKEDFLGSATHSLIEKCKLCLYYYPLELNSINEEKISDFFISHQNKIRNAIINYDCKSMSFKAYFFNYIKICLKYYKLKLNHDTVYDNMILEVLVKNTDSFEKETTFEEEENKPHTVATFKYKTVDEAEQNYYGRINSNDFKKGFSFEKLYNSVLNEKNIISDDSEFSYLNNIKENLSKKATRKNILLLFLTMPDSILDNYIDETTYLFSTNKDTIIQLFTYASNLLVDKKKQYEKFSNLNNKHYKNYLINNYKLSSNLFNNNQLKASIDWDKNAMDKNADKIRKTLNKHVSQRTLSRELNINKGTVASSISAAKRLLQNNHNIV